MCKVAPNQKQRGWFSTTKRSSNLHRDTHSLLDQAYNSWRHKKAPSCLSHRAWEMACVITSLGQEPSLARSWGVWLCMVVEKHLPVPSGAARYALEKGSHQQTGFSNIFRLSSPVKLICTYLLRFPYACSIYSVLIWSLCPARVLKTRHWIIFRLLLREPNVDLVISAL